MKYLDSLHFKHSNSNEIYILGSGPSLNHIDMAFFDGKIVICTNHMVCFVGDKCKHLYTVAKEPTLEMQKETHKRNGTLVTCKYISGNIGKKNKLLYPDEVVLFTPDSGAIRKPPNGNKLEKGASTIATSIHLAAYMGTKHIILAGHDCGTIDGEVHIKDYPKKHAVISEQAYGEWLRSASVEHNTLVIKEALSKYHHIKVYSLNPFINFGIEGHTYNSFTNR